MRRLVGFIIGLLVVGLAVADSVFFPAARLDGSPIDLPVSRMLACPVGDPALGTTTVKVADQEDFTAGVLNELPAEPQVTATFENPAKPIVVRGSSTVGGISTYTEDSATVAAPCAPPVTTGTWNNVVVDEGTSSNLVLTNVDDGAAVVDVFLYGQEGPLPVPGLSDITLASGVTQTLSIDQLVDSATPVSVQLRASKGRVSAILRTIGPTGYDWQPPQSSADTDLVVVGIPAGDGNRILSVTNTDPANKATVTVEVLGEGGSFAPLGLDSVEVDFRPC